MFEGRSDPRQEFLRLDRISSGRLTISGLAGEYYERDYPYEGDSLNVLLYCPSSNGGHIMGCGNILVCFTNLDGSVITFGPSSFSLWCVNCGCEHVFDHPAFSLPVHELLTL